MLVNLEEVVKCSFCGKPQTEVEKLIMGPESVYICNECIDICKEIIDGGQNETKSNNTILMESNC